MSDNQTLSYLSEIHKQCFEKGWEANEFADYEFILEQGKGFIAWQKIVDEAEIKTICVAPQFRGNGIANKLCKEMIAKCQGLKRILLEVDEANLAAINLYKKHGFIQYSLRKNYYSNGNNAVLMEKSLQK